MSVRGHSFLGAGPPCSCEVCLTVVRLGRTLLLPYLEPENVTVLLNKVRCVLNEAQDLADRDLQAFVATNPDSEAAPPATGSQRAPKTPGGGGGSKDSRKKPEEEKRKDKASPERSRGSREKPKPEEKKRTREKKHRTSSEETRKKPKHRPERERSRSPSIRPRKEKKIHRRQEDAEVEAEAPAEERRRLKSEVVQTPVKKEEETEEEGESSEEEEDPPVEDSKKNTPGEGVQLVPKPPSTPPPGAFPETGPHRPGPPGATYVPFPQHENSRPPLQRWKGPIPAYRPRAEPRHRDPRTGDLKEKPKGKKKKKRQREIRQAGGLANWHASKGSREGSW